MNLNFSLSELIYSETATIHKINNMPDITSLDNMLILIVECLQPLRDKLKKPINITSGYRCKVLNSAVKGAINSGHLRGTAADLVVKGMTTKELFNFIAKSGIKFTQLIEEYSNGHTWVHIEYNPKNLKCEKLLYQNGKYIKV